MAKSSAGDVTVGKIQKTRRQRVAKMYGQQKRNIIHTSSTAYEQDHSAAAHNRRARRPGRRNFISSLRERKRRRRRRPAMRLRLLAHHFRTGNRVYEGFVPLTSTSGSLLLLLAPRSLGQRTNRVLLIEQAGLPD
jgi:citrate lyase alpha subunit